MEKSKDECREHPGEHLRLICVEPCRTHLCQRCMESHRKHDLRRVEDVAGEMIRRLEERAREKTGERTGLSNQLQTLTGIKEDVQKYLNERLEEEKALELAITEPLKDIITGFQEKVTGFLKTLGSKQTNCDALEQAAMDRISQIYAEVDAVRDSLKRDDTCRIFDLWLQSGDRAPSMPAETSIKKQSEELQPELDLETLQGYADDLKNLNISEKMRIIVQAVTNTIQIQAADPLTQMGEHIARQKEDANIVKESLEMCQENLQKVTKETEAAAKELERGLKQMNAKVAELAKQKQKKLAGLRSGLDSLSKSLETSEEQLRSARDRLIIESKTADSQFQSLTEKTQDVSTNHRSATKCVADWERDLRVLLAENTDLGKRVVRTQESMEQFSKFLKKFNVQYLVRLQEFEKLDERMQYIRNYVSQSREPTEEQEEQRVFKLRLSVVSASASRVTALPLLNLFLSGSPDSKLGDEEAKEKVKAEAESETGVKGYSLRVRLSEHKAAEFDIWYLGCHTDMKSADPSFYKNVETILLVYDTEEGEQDSLEHIRGCADELVGKVSETAGIVLTGVSRKAAVKEGETGCSEESAVAHFAKERGIPVRWTDINSAENVKELFYRILYSRYPEAYESADEREDKAGE